MLKIGRATHVPATASQQYNSEKSAKYIQFSPELNRKVALDPEKYDTNSQVVFYPLFTPSTKTPRNRTSLKLLDEEVGTQRAHACAYTGRRKQDYKRIQES